MNWELVVVVSVYPRDGSGWFDPCKAGPVAEGVFSAGVRSPNDRQQMSQALAECTVAAERFLKLKGASLVTHVVVTVYSLEVSGHDTCCSH